MKNVLKKSLSVLLAFTIIFSTAYVGLNEVDLSKFLAVKTKAAGSGTCGDNLTWELDDEGTLTISGTGEMDDYAVDARPWKVSGIKKIVINDGVTYIGFEAFWDCNTLESVTLPDTLTGIGGCAFLNCESLTSIEIPDSVTSIGRGAFEGCDNLKEVYITDIESWCNIDFDDAESNPLCYADNLYLNGELVTEVVIPEGVTSIGDYAFSGCTNLESVTIPYGITSIGESVFKDCENLVSITLPNSVTSIGDYAFDGCSSLTSITIPDSVTSIGNYAFHGCNCLKSVTIGNGVTTIGYSSWSWVESRYMSVYIKDIAAWCGINFKDKTSNPCCSGANLYLNGKLLTDVVIPESVNSINDYAFYECYNITSVSISKNITSIGDSSFYGCSKLEAINVAPENNYFSSVDGVLFDKNKTSIILYPKNKKIGCLLFQIA